MFRSRLVHAFVVIALLQIRRSCSPTARSRLRIRTSECCSALSGSRMGEIALVNVYAVGEPQ